MPVATTALNFNFNISQTDAVHRVEDQSLYTTSRACSLAAAISFLAFLILATRFFATLEAGLGQLFFSLSTRSIAGSVMLMLMSVDQQLRIVIVQELLLTSCVDSCRDAEHITLAICSYEGALVHGYQPLTCLGRIPAPGIDIAGCLCVLGEPILDLKSREEVPVVRSVRLTTDTG